jgi:hypothetical protein
LDVEWLILLGSAAVIVLVVGGLAYAFGGSTRTNRYRPGRPYDFAPVWFLAAPERADGSHARALGGKPQAPALPTGEVEIGGPVPPATTGGASDHW